MIEDGTKIIVKQTRSTNRRTKRVKGTMEALGLGRIGKQREYTLNPALRGMIRKVRHLVEVTTA